MRLKLDENLGERGKQALRAAGHDVCTVAAEKLESALDRDLLAQCVVEDRGLVTLDLDFANPLVYPPRLHRGVAVIRLPHKAKRNDLDRAITTLVTALRGKSFAGELWIVEVGRIRVYTPAA